MSRRGPVAAIAVAATVAGVLIATGAVFGQGADGGSGETGAVGPPDSTPVGRPTVAARAPAHAGRQLAVATYRNKDGRVCAALGLENNGELRDRRGRALPLDQGGDCTMRPQPVAVQVIQQANDPTTPGDERSIIVWGLAAKDVSGVDAAVGDQHQTATPGRDGAFVASLAPRQGQVKLTLSRTSQAPEQIILPAPPDITELNRRLKDGSIPSETTHP